MPALLVAAVIRFVVVSMVLITAVIRFVMMVPFVVFTSGKLRASEVAVVSEGHGAEESEEGKDNESSEVHGLRRVFRLYDELIEMC